MSYSSFVIVATAIALLLQQSFVSSEINFPYPPFHFTATPAGYLIPSFPELNVGGTPTSGLPPANGIIRAPPSLLAQVRFPPIPTTQLTLHFTVCFGMFNQYRAIAAAAWLVASLASEQTRFLRPLHLRLPRLIRSFGSEERSPFSHFFDLPHMQSLMRQYNVTVSEALPGERCPHKLILPIHMQKIKQAKLRKYRTPYWQKRTAEEVIEYANYTLKYLPTRCIVLHTKIRNELKKCLFFLSHSSDQVLTFGQQFLQFSRGLTQYALWVHRKVGGPYTAVHFRVEYDAPHIVQGKLQTGFSLNFSELEPCLRYHYPQLGKFPLYLAVASVVFTYPNYRAWRKSTSLQVITKRDIFPSTLRLGREEWAAIEALILVYSNQFLGYYGSSLTEFVQYTRNFSTPTRPRSLPNASVYWNVNCSTSLFLPPGTGTGGGGSTDFSYELNWLANEMLNRTGAGGRGGGGSGEDNDKKRKRKRRIAILAPLP